MDLVIEEVVATMTKRQKKSKNPANKTAKCLLHKRYMNDVYIHRHGGAVRQCKPVLDSEGS